MITTASNADASPRLGVGADLQFLVRSGEKPRTYAFAPPDGGPRSNARYIPQRVQVGDARRHAAEFELDRHGFAFVQHASAVRDFWNEDEVKQVYYPEAERLIRTQTGADRVWSAFPAGGFGGC